MWQLILGGLLGLPGLLLSVIVAPVIALLSIPSLYFLLHHGGGGSEKKKHNHNNNTTATATATPPRGPTHAIISGGSSGIGLALAHELLRKPGGEVKQITLLARNLEKLEAAKQSLLKSSSNESVTINIRSVDVTDYTSLGECMGGLTFEAEDYVVVWNCAGYAYPCEFLKTPMDQFRKQVETNQLGSIYLTRAVLPHLIQCQKATIVFTSSGAGQLGVYGYTSYAPTKYALRGFAETLHMELQGMAPHVSVQVAFPVDTDTPGYHQELLTAPKITQKLSETATLATPESTAQAMVNAIQHAQPPFLVYFGFEGWMLAQVTAGLSPPTTLKDAVAQVAGMSLLRWIGMFVLMDWKTIIQNNFPHDKDETTPNHIKKE